MSSVCGVWHSLWVGIVLWIEETGEKGGCQRVVLRRGNRREPGEIPSKTTGGEGKEWLVGSLVVQDRAGTRMHKGWHDHWRVLLLGL